MGAISFAMNVTELITVTNRLCINHTDLDEKERATYLTFLNLANKEIYTVASKGLKTLNIRKKLFLNEDLAAFVLPPDLYNIRKVFATNDIVLSQSDIDESLTRLKGYLVEGNNLYCDLTGRHFTLPLAADPDDNNVVKKYITLIYCSPPKKLVELVNDPSTEINIPVYPEVYHHYLVHGALYYFYLANMVFLQKSQDIAIRWEQDLKEIANFKNYGL